MKKQFNNQFATQKLRAQEDIEETSTTGGDGAYPTIARKKNPGAKPIAAGKAKNYVKDHWGWKEAPSIPNRPSKGGFIYKQLYENLNENYSEGDYVKILDPESRLHGMKAHIHDIHDDGTALVILDEPKKTPTTVDLSKLRKVELNENYSRFKKETKTRTNEQQLHAAMRLAEKKIHEANRILEYTAQLRTELTETKVNKNTQKLMEKVTKGIAEAYGKMKKLK